MLRLFIIGIKHGFSCINIRQVPWEVLNTEAEGGSNEYSQSMFWAETWKISEFFFLKISSLGEEIFYLFE